MFATLRGLAYSYLDEYVDYTGRLRGYGVANLAEAMGRYDWRWTSGNVWKVEQMLIDWPHVKLPSSDARYRALKRKYRQFRKANGERKPIFYQGREKWSPLPAEYQRRLRRRRRSRPGTPRQSRSKPRRGLVIGSSCAFFSASSKRRDSASPLFFSSCTDCAKSASRRAA